jgi:serine/threonine protein kinase
LSKTNFKDFDSLKYKTFAHYRLEKEIGQGGYGIVYLGHDTKLLRKVAIKILKQNVQYIPDEFKVLRHEAITASSLNHPCICTIYDIDSYRNIDFIVMEYIDEQTLRQILEENKILPEEQVLVLLKKLCETLAVSHNSGLIHQQIKPENIFFDYEKDFVKLVDFGIIKMASMTAERMSKDKSKVIKHSKRDFTNIAPYPYSSCLLKSLGSLDYLSPQQINNEKIDETTDLFSLGVLIFETLTGKNVFKDDDKKRNASGNTGEALSVKRYNPSLSKSWQIIIDKTLNKEKNQRYQSIIELADDLDRLFPESKDSYHIKTRLKTNNKDKNKKYKTNFLIGAACVFLICMGLFLNDTIFQNQLNRKTEFENSRITTQSKDAYAYFIKGQNAWWRYDLKTAIRNLKMAVEIDSSLSYASALLAVIQSWEDMHDEKDKYMLKAKQTIHLASDWEELLVNGFLSSLNKEHETALLYFTRLIENYPDKIDGYLGAAWACECLKDFDRAITLTEQVIKLDSNHIASHGNLSDMYVKKFDYVKAEFYAKKELELIKSSGDMAGVEGAYDLLGRIYYLKKNMPLAIKNLKESLRIDPKNFDASLNLIQALAFHGDIEAAEKLYLDALTMPYFFNLRRALYMQLATFYYSTGRHKDALLNFKHSRDLCEQAGDYRYILLITRQICEMHSCFKNSLAIENEIEWLQIKIKDYKIPHDDFQKEINITLYTYLALSSNNIKRSEKLIASQRNSNAANTIFLINNTQLLILKGRDVEAIQMLTKYLDTNTFSYDDQSILWYHLALLYAKQKDYNKAIFYSQSVLSGRKFIPYYCQAFALLSEIYESIGDYKRAKGYCEQFLDIWKYADKDLPLLISMEERQGRIQRKMNKKIVK